MTEGRGQAGEDPSVNMVLAVQNACRCTLVGNPECEVHGGPDEPDDASRRT